MFERRPNLIAFRGCMVAVCLALLAGCLPRTDNPAAPRCWRALQATAGDAVVTLTWTASMGSTGYNENNSSTSGGLHIDTFGLAHRGRQEETDSTGDQWHHPLRFNVSALIAASRVLTHSTKVS